MGSLVAQEPRLKRATHIVQTHLPFLDGFRGLASLWVIAGHSLFLSGWSFPLLCRADLAVDLFMVLSGFLMTFHYLGRRAAEPWDSGTTWVKFWLRRFFRIAPLYYTVLMAGLMLGPILNDYRHSIGETYIGTARPEACYLDHGFANALLHATFLFGLLPEFAHRSPLPDWSIGLEMQFYFAFPFLMLLLRNKHHFFWFAAAAFAVSQAASVSGIAALYPMPTLLPMKLCCFVIGMLLAAAHSHQPMDRKLTACVAGTALMLTAVSSGRTMYCLAALMAAILFYDCGRDVLRIKRPLSWARNILQGPMAKRLADLSYSVYLLHLLIMIPIAGTLTRSEGYLQLHGSARFLLVFTATVLVVYPVGWVLYNFIERPGIAWGKKMVRRIGCHPTGR